MKNGIRLNEMQLDIFAVAILSIFLYWRQIKNIILNLETKLNHIKMNGSKFQILNTSQITELRRKIDLQRNRKTNKQSDFLTMLWWHKMAFQAIDDPKKKDKKNVHTKANLNRLIN